jgi:Flp pilus assembly protein CpaB
MTAAALGVFAASSGAADRPSARYAVAVGDLDAGTPLDERNTRFVEMHLADEVAAGAFTDPAQLTGRRLLAPLFDGDLLQASGVSDRGTPDRSYEVSFAVPRAYAVGGRVRRGDRVDVYVTRDDATELVVRRAEVIQAPGGGDGGLDSRSSVVVLRLEATADVAAVVHAARAGDVTLVRSTFAEPAGEAGS